MSDTISHIYSEYSNYEILCKKYNITPIELGANTDWYKHFIELENKEKERCVKYE